MKIILFLYYTPFQYDKCLEACRTAAAKLFDFFRLSVERKLSKVKWLSDLCYVFQLACLASLSMTLSQRFWLINSCKVISLATSFVDVIWLVTQQAK